MADESLTVGARHPSGALDEVDVDGVVLVVVVDVEGVVVVVVVVVGAVERVVVGRLSS